MRNRFAFALTGLAIAVSSLGCCCHQNRCNPCGGGSPYGVGYAPAGQSPCGPGGCQPSYYPQTGMNGGYDYAATAYNMPATTTTMASSPYVSSPAYPTTAALPLNSLPTH